MTEQEVCCSPGVWKTSTWVTLLVPFRLSERIRACHVEPELRPKLKVLTGARVLVDFQEEAKVQNSYRFRKERNNMRRFKPEKLSGYVPPKGATFIPESHVYRTSEVTSNESIFPAVFVRVRVPVRLALAPRRWRTDKQSGYGR